MPPVGFEPKISAGERPQAAHLLRSWVRLPPGAWIFDCCECRVLSGRGLCDELITRPEEPYRLWCVVVCDLENLKNEEAMTRVGSQRHKKKPIYWHFFSNNHRSKFLGAKGTYCFPTFFYLRIFFCL